MEAYLILIHIVLFSSDNTNLDNKAEVESCQTYYMLFLHRYIMLWWIVVVQFVSLMVIAINLHTCQKNV